MKRAKQILGLLPFYLLSLSVSPASAQSITLSTSTTYYLTFEAMTTVNFSTLRSGYSSTGATGRGRRDPIPTASRRR